MVKAKVKGRGRRGGRGKPAAEAPRGLGLADRGRLWREAMSFDRFAEVLHSIVVMIDNAGEVSNCDVSGPGCYIDNFGTNADRAEAFLTLLPIVQRIMDRPEDKVEKVSVAFQLLRDKKNERRAAVKGKKPREGKAQVNNGA